jgi:hypothetical protein
VYALAPTVNVHLVNGVSGWDYIIVGGCTIVATVAGFLAIVLTIRQGQRAQADLVRDRRATFELSVIADLSRRFEQDASQSEFYAGLVWILPRAEFPVLYAWAFERGPLAQGQIRDEIYAAIVRRVQAPS